MDDIPWEEKETDSLNPLWGEDRENLRQINARNETHYCSEKINTNNNKSDNISQRNVRSR